MIELCAAAPRTTPSSFASTSVASRRSTCPWSTTTRCSRRRRSTGSIRTSGGRRRQRCCGPAGRSRSSSPSACATTRERRRARRARRGVGARGARARSRAAAAARRGDDPRGVRGSARQRLRGVLVLTSAREAELRVSATLTALRRVQERTAAEIWAVFETTARYHRLSETAAGIEAESGGSSTATAEPALDAARRARHRAASPAEMRVRLKPHPQPVLSASSRPP